VTVTVGFAPATTPGLVTGGTTAAADEGAPEGLFAALLAMFAPGQTPDEAATDQITSGEFGALIQTLAAEATSPAKEPEKDGQPDEVDDAENSAEASTTVGTQLEDLQKTQGKSLLKDLGDALVALSDAVESGQPVDPALEKKLNEAMDALTIYLGTVNPPPSVDPRISALASGEGVLPSVTEAPPPAPAPPTAAAPTTDLPEAAATSPQPAPPAPAADLPEVPAEFARLVAGVDPAAAEEPAVAAAAPAKGATTLEEAPPALRQMGLYIGKLSEKLAAQDPELAKKLDALAETLKSGTLPDELATALGLDDAGAEPELRRILEALAAPKPTATKPVEAKTFAAPSLELPQAVVAPAKKDEPVAAAPAVSDPAPKLEATEPEIARPIAASATARPEKPDTAEAKPAPAPAQASTPQSTAADASSTAAQPTQPAAVQAARTVHAAYQTPLQQVNLPQVAFEVVRQFEAGNSRFQIRLDPPDLGRIDVKLDVDKSGTVNARMTVERPETLDLMQRDQRALQQALQQAGLDASKTNLEFSLRQNPFAGQGGMGEGQGQQPGFAGNGSGLGGEEPLASEIATSTYRGTASAGGVNLFV